MMDKIKKIYNLFYLGYYDECLNMLIGTSSESASDELGILLWRCKGLAYGLNTSQINFLKESESPALRAIAANAAIRKTNSKSDSELAYSNLKNICELSDNLTAKFLLVSATAAEGNFVDALEMTENGTPEILAARAMILLSMGKIDSFQNTFETICDVNGDSVIPSLLSALDDIVNGHHQGASETYQELAECINDGETEESNVLLNYKGIANLMQHNWLEAVECFERSYKKCSRDENAIINLICSYRNLQQRRGQLETLENKLLEIAPRNPFVVKMKELNEAFESFDAS